jgi:hypothetical protein
MHGHFSPSFSPLRYYVSGGWIRNDYNSDWEQKRSESVPCNCDHLLIYCAPQLSSNHSLLTHQSSLLWMQQRNLAVKQGENWWEMSENFDYKYLFSCCKIRWHGDDSFIPPTQKEDVPQILTTLKNPLSLAGFGPTNLGSNGKHDKQVATENK